MVQTAELVLKVDSDDVAKADKALELLMEEHSGEVIDCAREGSRCPRRYYDIIQGNVL